MKVSKYLLFRPAFCITLLGLVFSISALAGDSEAGEESIARGEYLARVAGCNDCHTAGYPEAAGNIPKNQWLLGTQVGFQGPWGASYPSNLRLYFADIDEKQWLERARLPLLPPMPWFALRDMSDADLLSIYRFVRSLGPAGEKMPAPVGPGLPITTPYIEFVPKNLPLHAAAQ